MMKNILIIRKTKLLFLLTFFFHNHLISQNEEDYREFVVEANYNKPLGKLNWIYKPSPGIQFGFNWVKENYEEQKINKKGISVGVIQFQPKADTLFYLVPPNSYGSAVYSKYIVINGTYHIENIKT